MTTSTKRLASCAWAAFNAAVCLALAGCEQPPAPAEVIKPVKVIVVGQPGGEGGRAFPGTVQAVERAKLSFRISGPLIKRPVVRGQEVRKGQVLAQIDPSDFQNSVDGLEATVAQLKSQYEAMKTSRPEDIRSAEANLSAARARELETRANFRRYQRLYENDNVSKAELDQRRAAQDVTIAEVASAEQQLRIAKIGARVEDIRAMEARIQSVEAELRQALDNLAYTTMVAPYDGIVSEIYVENFEYVTARQEVLSLQNISNVEIVAQIPEQLVARAGREMAAENLMPEFLARFEAIPGHTYDATPFEVSGEADPMTRTYAVTFRTPQPAEGRIFSGMTAEVLLKAPGEQESVFTVPARSVFADSDGATNLWIVDTSSMTVSKRPVEVGSMIEEAAIITSGLNVGDTIVTAGAGFLVEGQKVREVKDELRERR